MPQGDQALASSRHPMFNKVPGGLGLGTVGTSALFLTAILGLVIYLTVTREDVIETQPVSP